MKKNPDKDPYRDCKFLPDEYIYTGIPLDKDKFSKAPGFYSERYSGGTNEELLQYDLDQVYDFIVRVQGFSRQMRMRPQYLNYGMYSGYGPDRPNPLAYGVSNAALHRLDKKDLDDVALEFLARTAAGHGHGGLQYGYEDIAASLIGKPAYYILKYPELFPPEAFREVRRGIYRALQSYRRHTHVLSEDLGMWGVDSEAYKLFSEAEWKAREGFDGVLPAPGIYDFFGFTDRQRNNVDLGADFQERLQQVFPAGQLLRYYLRSFFDLSLFHLFITEWNLQKYWPFNPLLQRGEFVPKYRPSSGCGFSVKAVPSHGDPRFFCDVDYFISSLDMADRYATSVTLRAGLIVFRDLSLAPYFLWVHTLGGDYPEISGSYTLIALFIFCFACSLLVYGFGRTALRAAVLLEICALALAFLYAVGAVLWVDQTGETVALTLILLVAAEFAIFLAVSTKPGVLEATNTKPGVTRI